MIFRIATPGGGTVTVEVKPSGVSRDSRDQRIKVYFWTCNAFLGRHGDPFGTLVADSIEHARDMTRDIVVSRLRAKHA